MNEKKIEPVHGFQVYDRFIYQNIRNMGWSAESSIFEFVDNSIDAKSSTIKIDWNKIPKVDKEDTTFYEFSIEDNGTGVEAKNMIPSFTGLGTPTEITDYQEESIGNYGSGGTSALLNLCTVGNIDIRSSHKENKETTILPIALTADNTKPAIEPKIVEYDKKPGTSIKIDKVKARLTDSSLMKKAGVTYFPNYDRTLEPNKEPFGINVNGKKVDFIDPFYRNTKWGHSDGVSRKTVKVKVGNEVLDMEVLKFMPNFEESNLVEYHWDVRGKAGSLLRDNAGLYIRVGGRYVNTGKNLFPGTARLDKLKNIRFEITIPHHLLEPCGIEVNKAKVTLPDGSSMLEDLERVIRRECKEFINEWVKTRGKNLSNDDKKLLKHLNERFNSKLKKKALPSLAKGRTGKLIEKRKSKGRNPNGTGVTPKNTGRKRSGNTRAGNKKIVSWNFEYDGRANNMYSWNKSDDGVLHITLNLDTEWGAMFPKGAGSEAEMDSLLWEIYAGIYVGLNKAADIGDVEGQLAAEEYTDKMVEEVEAMTYHLNKVLG